MPISQEEVALHKYSIEEQVAICICGMYREPPAMHLAYALADAGDKVVPLLIERLKAQKEEAGQRNIIYILKILFQEGQIGSKEDGIKEIERVVAVMKDEVIRNRSQAMLEEIEGTVNKK